MRLRIPVDESHALPGVILTVGPLRPASFSLQQWRNQVLREGVPPGTLREVSREALATEANGWPIALFVTDGGGERRAHAFVEILEWIAVVEASGAPEAIDAALPEIRRLLAGVTVDWTSEQVHALWQVWEEFPQD